MQRAACEQCGTLQPPQWQPGELCSACGAQVRREVRCPWCASWTPAVKFCRGCGCEVVDPALFGAARMLKDAGVDRLTLVERLRALDPGQLATFSAQYAAQWAIVARRVDEARLCESYLLQSGFSRDLEDDYVPALPLGHEQLDALSAGPSGPFVRRDDLLDEIEAKSPSYSTRNLATLALLRLGKITNERVTTALELSWERESAMGLEAALALSHWRIQNGELGRRLDARRRVEVGATALRGIDHAKMRPYAALSSAWGATLARWSRDDEESKQWLAALEPALREGLTAGDEDLRFGCALVLIEEPVLGPALDDADELKRELARSALAKASRGLMFRRMMQSADDDERRSILRQLPQPWSLGALEAALGAFAKSGPEFRRDVLRWIRNRRWRELDGDEKRMLDRFLEQEARALSAEDLLDLLEWASDAEYGKARPSATEVQAFLDAVTALLGRLDPAARDQAIREGSTGFTRWLGYARESDAALRSQLLCAPQTIERTWSALRQLENDRTGDSREPSPLPLQLFLSVIDGLDRGARLAFAREVFARSRDLYSIGGHREWVAAIWERFQRSEDERLAFFILARATRIEAELDEEIRKAIPDWPRGGKDPIETFRVLLSLDEDRVYDAVDRVMPGIDPARVPALWKAAYAAAEKFASKATVSLTPTSRFMRWFEEHLWSSEVSPLAPENAPWREMLPEFQRDTRALVAKVTATPGEDETWRNSKAAEIEEELTRLDRLIAEAQARVDEQAARERERAERDAQRAREHEEQQRRQEELERQRRAQQEEQQRQIAAQRQQIDAQRQQATADGGTSIDDEPFLSNQPLRSLREYAGFIKALQKGGDVLALMAAHGLDPTSWGACASAWGTLLSTRTDLAIRFSQLLQQP